MAEGIKISELTEVETLQDGCCFPVISEIDGSMQNVKIKKKNLEKALISNIYSTEETIIGKWIDGKPIYRKVFNHIPYKNISELNIDCPIRAYGFCSSIISYGVNPPTSYPIKPSYYDLYALINFNRTNISITKNWDNGDFSDNTIIIEYTKTTD